LRGNGAKSAARERKKVKLGLSSFDDCGLNSYLDQNQKSTKLASLVLFWDVISRSKDRNKEQEHMRLANRDLKRS